MQKSGTPSGAPVSDQWRESWDFDRTTTVESNRVVPKDPAECEFCGHAHKDPSDPERRCQKWLPRMPGKLKVANRIRRCRCIGQPADEEFVEKGPPKSTVPRPCAACGADFMWSRESPKFCDGCKETARLKCFREAREKRKLARASATLDRVKLCAFCGARIEPLISRAKGGAYVPKILRKYCGNECERVAHNIKQNAKANGFTLLARPIPAR